MGRYECDAGEILVPRKEWASFRRSIINRYNEQQESRYAKAKRLRKDMLAAARGKHEEEIAFAVNKVMDALLDAEGVYEAHAIASDMWGGGLPLAPRRMHFQKMPVGRSAVLRVGCLEVALCNYSATLRWKVHGGSLEVTRARESWLGTYVINRLKLVKWGRASGGYIEGNYDHPGSGREKGTTEQLSFGPIGENHAHIREQS